MKQFGWTELHNCPSKPGIYAWYYNPEITKFDLNEVVVKIEELKKQNNREDAEKAIEIFLNNFIFNQFSEEPYQVILKGQLKPKYEGDLNHIPHISTSLIDRIVEIPQRLSTIKTVIEKSAPYFSAPIYIGMSENLQKRLSKHKFLIETFNQKKSNNISFVPLQPNDNIEKRDQSFAWQVCKRNIPPTKMFVMIRIIEKSGNAYVDIENILNRIYYPLFGRN